MKTRMMIARKLLVIVNHVLSRLKHSCEPEPDSSRQVQAEKYPEISEVVKKLSVTVQITENTPCLKVVLVYVLEWLSGQWSIGSSNRDKSKSMAS